MKFELTEKQMAQVKEWRKTLPQPKLSGTIGDRISYTFVPTSIGDFVTVQDAVSGEKLDITGDL